PRDTGRARGRVAGLEGTRRLPDDLAEARAERAQAAEADGVAHLGDGEVRGAQQVLGALDAPLGQVRGRAEPVGRREQALEVEPAEPGDRGQLGEVERLGEVAVRVVARRPQVLEHVVVRSRGHTGSLGTPSHRTARTTGSRRNGSTTAQVTPIASAIRASSVPRSGAGSSPWRNPVICRAVSTGRRAPTLPIVAPPASSTTVITGGRRSLRSTPSGASSPCASRKTAIEYSAIPAP